MVSSFWSTITDCVWRERYKIALNINISVSVIILVSSDRLMSVQAFTYYIYLINRPGHLLHSCALRLQLDACQIFTIFTA